ncbi:uncharacterized protein LOC108208423 isoform X2 [Daucus carota subsp. sativus]|nr:PREDICTED: uncharacterized protein LOC108208423 [Daucus carota subsp. sativus]XP_017236519.1 PREDICTED: uncharacterized protein LOC108209860 [Daucus carota subsp. sativus]
MSSRGNSAHSSHGSRRQGKQPMAPPADQPTVPAQKRGYLAWTPEMDSILTSTLYDQINEGNKGDGNFKSQAYQAVVDKLRIEKSMLVTVEHVKHRIKIWKKHYGVISDIRNYTKFNWDEEKKMLVIPIEDLVEWKAYCEGCPDASAYQNKCIQNWDDICTLFASDRATGDGAEQFEESATAMELENDISTAETGSGESNKRQKRDRLADAVTSFAESFKEYVSKAKEPPRPTCKEIYEVVSEVIGITDDQAMRAVKRFVNGKVDEFEMLKNLPDNEKKRSWIMLLISDS